MVLERNCCLSFLFTRLPSVIPGSKRIASISGHGSILNQNSGAVLAISLYDRKTGKCVWM